jgi:superfamily I DNA/RNA helicase/RecB family exonuclease
LLEFDTDEQLRAAEQARVRHLFVDDAQHLNPLQFELVNMLGATAAEFILMGDPDQAIFSFRGADPRLLTDADPDGNSTVVLHVDHRMTPAVRDAVARLTARLPGTGPHRDLTGPSEPTPATTRPGDKTPEGLGVKEGPTSANSPTEPRANELNITGSSDRATGLTGSGGGATGSADPGRVDVRLFASAAQEASWVADQLRRAHLLDGVPWERMAVLVRSAERSLPVLRRALLGAGVPLAVAAESVPLARHPIVRPFLELVRLATRKEEVDEETATFLLSGPLGGADALAQRRLRRGLRRLELAAGGSRGTSELLVEALESGDVLASLEPGEAAPVRKLAGLLKLARDTIAAGAGIEQVLWELWTASGLQRRLVDRCARGGPIGAQADRDLDAVLVLFDAAAGYTDRLPGAGAAGFAEYLGGQQIVGDSLAPSAPHGESVALLTAHAAAGREWDVVAVPGVQEGSWPDLRLRGSLLGVEKLVDLVAGIDLGSSTTISATAPLLAEERRLLRMAASRARQVLLVSAVRGEDEQPSRFLDELDGSAIDPDASVRPVRAPERALVLSDLVGELRQAVCADATTPEDQARRRRAARQLSRLADAGVPGADPRTWYGLSEISTKDPLWTEEDEVRVSPSTVEVLTRCPLRWFAERHGGADPSELPSITGSLVHALAQAVAEGADADAVTAALDQAWEMVDAGAPWFSRRERARVARMVDAFRAWLSLSRNELSQVAVEESVDVRPGRVEGGPWLRVRGRVDRLETDAEGRAVVVDLKTGKNPPTKADAAEHPQLAVYQVAAALGAFGELGLRTEPGGARLVYLAKENKKTGATELVQPPLDEPGVAKWLDVVGEAAATCVGPEYTASENSDCPRCPARTSCPLHDDGRQVGQ